MSIAWCVRRTSLGHRAHIAFAGAVAVLWVGLVSLAVAHFWRIDATPGMPASPPRSVNPPVDSSTVLLFLHPQCPCSRATLSELSRVAARVTRPVKYHVYFVVANPGDRGWQHSPLYAQAARLPDAAIEADALGVQAQRYGVHTSGQLIVYGADGALAFSGGITPSRGHEGDNAGKDRLLGVLNATSSRMPEAPVYGCRLPAGPLPLSKVSL